MFNFLINYLIKIHKDAADYNISNILSFIKPRDNVKLLDLGCNDGSLTLRMSNKLRTSLVYGIDIVDERLKIASELGIKTIKCDLNNELPLDSDSFDVIVSNQVIEHLLDVDKFAAEIYRILKPGGYAIISTENLSSWHNIFSLLFGFQAFSQDISYIKRIGIPFHLDLSPDNNLPSWLHIKIFTYFGLKSFFSVHGFDVESIKGAGYYPFPAIFKKLCLIDPLHTHFITVKIRKKDVTHEIN